MTRGSGTGWRWVERRYPWRGVPKRQLFLTSENRLDNVVDHPGTSEGRLCSKPWNNSNVSKWIWVAGSVVFDDTPMRTRSGRISKFVRQDAPGKLRCQWDARALNASHNWQPWDHDADWLVMGSEHGRLDEWQRSNLRGEETTSSSLIS